jgi:hypothetical protein
MPKDKISQYAFTPAANTDIGGINIDEGCAPSGINNAIRTLMTQIRDLQAGVSGDTVPLTAGGTGSGTAASARAALGLAIGTNVLGYVTPGTSGNILQSDGTNWTSKASTAVTLDTITGGPLAIAKGGTNATTAAQARTTLGLAIGTNVLGYVTAGATGQVLTSTGTGWVSQAAASGGFSNMQVFASPGTFTTPATTTQIKVTVVGGGGGGSRNDPVSGIGSGGAGGGAAIYVGPVTVSTPYTVTVGTGGAGGTAFPSPGTGGTGNTSSFGPLASATGGAGGVTSTTSALGGLGSAGTLQFGGGVGVARSSLTVPGTPAPTVTSISGSGGSSYLGGGGNGVAPGAVGVNGRAYGGGGSGSSGGPNIGGAGAAGVVIVEY